MGFRVLQSLSIKDLYKAYLMLDHSEAQNFQAIALIPTTFKPLYGFISDNVPLCGRYRMSYIRVFTAIFILVEILCYFYAHVY